jgi:hypothetical protein
MWRTDIYCSLESVNFYRRNCFAFGCESVIVEVQRKNINKSVLGTATDLVGKSRGDQEGHGLRSV